MTYKEDMCFHKEDMCVLLSVNIRYQSTLCIIIHEELGAIECLNSWHVLTLSPFQFHKNKSLKSMSLDMPFCFIV